MSKELIFMTLEEKNIRPIIQQLKYVVIGLNNLPYWNENVLKEQVNANIKVLEGQIKALEEIKL